MIRTARFGWNDEGPIDRDLSPAGEQGLEAETDTFLPPPARRRRRRPQTSPQDQKSPPNVAREESDRAPSL